MAKRMHKNHGMSIDKICKLLKISRANFYRYIAMSEIAKHGSVASLE
jgi:predicted transcriptional regulator